MGDIENQSITGGADQPNSLEINAPGSVITKENPLQETIQPQGIGRDDFLGLSALRSMAAEQRRKNSTPLTPEVNNSSMPLITWKAIPRGIRALVNSGLVLGAVYSRTKEMGEIDRRRFLKGGLQAALLTAVVALVGCGPKVENGINTVSNPESVEPTEGIDGLALLEKDTWSPDEFLQYLTFAGIGGIMSYRLAEAVFEDPRRDFLRTLWSAANNGENHEYRKAIYKLFDPADNTITAATGHLVPKTSLVNPNQFKSLTFTKKDGTIPSSWFDAEFEVATEGIVTDQAFGSRTVEYISTGETISNLDFDSGTITFLGETRSSKNVAINFTDTTGKSVNIIAPRRVMFQNFSKDHGYRLIKSDGSNQEVILTHLEARHPIAKTDVDNLINSIGTDSSALYIVRSAADNSPVQVGIRRNDGALVDVIFRTDQIFMNLIHEDRIEDAIQYLKTRQSNNDGVITAFQPYSRLQGRTQGVQALLERERSIHALLPDTKNPVYVLESIGSGEWVHMPDNGTIDVRIAAQLGRYLRAHPRYKQIFDTWMGKIMQQRPKLRLSFGLIGAALTGTIQAGLEEAANAIPAATIYRRYEEYASRFDPCGDGELIHPNAPYDSYRQGFTFGVSASKSFIDKTTGQIVTNTALTLPPLHGLPSTDSQVLSYFCTESITPTNPPTSGEIPIINMADNITRINLSNNPYNYVKVDPSIMTYLYAGYNGVHPPHVNPESKTRFKLGVPTLPVTYGESPKNIGLYLRPDGSIHFCIIDYHTEGGVSEGAPDLGTSFQVPITTTNIRDIVDTHKSYSKAVNTLTPQQFEERTADYLITYSIINNDTVKINIELMPR